ncbi:hypothetical protein [Aeromonas sp. S16(2024)]|uniref:hypothetical protein n=1 Tax=Aeromonas sp. S16(2024) TaxID=3242889 RepID=UPI003527BA10
MATAYRTPLSSEGWHFHREIADNRALSFLVPAYSARSWMLDGPGKVGVDGKYLK